jgi:hypothetical protein
MDPFDRMISDPFQHLAQIILWVEAVELCRLCRPPNYAERARFPQKWP